jgi:hypothetical protein
MSKPAYTVVSKDGHWWIEGPEGRLYGGYHYSHVAAVEARAKDMNNAHVVAVRLERRRVRAAKRKAVRR